jgi:uncharacterized membrane protein
MQKKGAPRWKKFLFSELLVGKNTTHKIAYIAVLAALNVTVNAVSTISLGFVQFSITLFVCAITGILIGPLFGFTACFLGDTLGYIIGNSGGGGWTPWIGLSMGTAAIIAALIMHGIPLKGKCGLYVKIAIVCVLTFFICTYAINTTAAYYLWNAKGLDYIDFLIARMSVQIWNNVINSLLLFVAVPLLGRIKALKMQVNS